MMLKMNNYPILPKIKNIVNKHKKIIVSMQLSHSVSMVNVNSDQAQVDNANLQHCFFLI
jgi:electron transfer flavoprotein alpha/beta subunit